MEFVVKTEDELNEILNTQTLLTVSKGDYGLDCLFHDGDLEVDEKFFYDENLLALSEKYGVEVGTIAIRGNLNVKGHMSISDRLYLLFVTGNIVCNKLSTFETEVYVGGEFIAEAYFDHDGYVRLQKETTAKRFTYNNLPPQK